MATKRDKMIINLDGLLPIKLHDSLITWSYKITWQTKFITFSIPVSMTTKLGRTVTYRDETLPINLNDHLVM